MYITAFCTALIFTGISGYTIISNKAFANTTELEITTTISELENKQKKVNDISVHHIEIPIINVNAIIESVGLTPEGAVGVPKGPRESAWFNLGAYPGEAGNAIIVGHSGWKNGMPAVFDELHKLLTGDAIYIQDNDGTSMTFRVREIKIYNQYEDASHVFISNDGKSHLNLITCTGAWSTLQNGRLDRLVIFTDKVEEEGEGKL